MPAPARTPALGPAAPIRVLVVANETASAPALHEALAGFAPGESELLVVAPARNGRLSHWANDDRVARARARERVLACLDALAVRGHDANGQIGDSDPLLAIEDGLAVFPADEILVVTHPPGASNWLERDLVARVIERFPVTITHLVVEPARSATTRPRPHRFPLAA